MREQRRKRMNRLVIFDGNHLAYRALYKFANLKTFDGANTSVIYGMPFIAESLIRRLAPDKVAMTFDGGRSPFRMGLLPLYKQRDKKLGFDYDDFKRMRTAGSDIFTAMGIQVAWKKDFEADDLIAMIARRYSIVEWDVVIVSADKDFNQLIMPLDPGLHGPVSVFNVGKNLMLDYHTLKETTGYYPEQCVDYLSLTGDKSDNIPGYPGIGPKKALDILHRWGSIKQFICHDASYGKVDKMELEKIRAINKKMIDLRYFYRKFLMHEPIPWLNPTPEFDEDRLRSICNVHEINSFLKPQFINTFKKLIDA